MPPTLAVIGYIPVNVFLLEQPTKSLVVQLIFASRGKIAPCSFAICRQNNLSGYFAASAKIAISLMLTQTLTLISTLAVTLTQTEKKHYFASRGKIATS